MRARPRSGAGVAGRRAAAGRGAPAASGPRAPRCGGYGRHPPRRPRGCGREAPSCRRRAGRRASRFSPAGRSSPARARCAATRAARRGPRVPAAGYRRRARRGCGSGPWNQPIALLGKLPIFSNFTNTAINELGGSRRHSLPRRGDALGITLNYCFIMFSLPDLIGHRITATRDRRWRPWATSPPSLSPRCRCRGSGARPGWPSAR